MTNSIRSPFVSHSKEFSLIHKYFNLPAIQRSNSPYTNLGIGDDCALLEIPNDTLIAISTDTLVEHRHFLVNTDPADIAYKAFMVSISDLAAMGATPRWVSLALTLPRLDDLWLNRFSLQLFKLLDAYDMQLIGGDTTKGPLAITLTVQGTLPKDTALKRSNAKDGDAIFLSGTIGNSALGLKMITDVLNDEINIHHVEQDLVSQRNLILDTFLPIHHIDIAKPQSEHVTASNLNKNHTNDLGWMINWLKGSYLYPKAQVELGLAIREIANSAIDISDGLASDLNHICASSGLSANVILDSLPISQTFKSVYEKRNINHTKEELFSLALSGGDDYQLCFTVDNGLKDDIVILGKQLNIPLTCIGNMKKSNVAEVCYFHDGDKYELILSGFDHFSS
ncbi:thiamine-phosphate kinase [Thorsellia anophelis]|uniref:Thiamine-monophosphate kinase n=1 Tax=Thorsellia anophelis DSM 18579 TaxID=1123402 RepID=A0A1I0EHE3_9GAMM|nr:thiamine-phosphate kinase [Thorsellia anophelis]SET43875.1 thiamine-monophosphate kinase [Thorsellia anophelis DSM 18579]